MALPPALPIRASLPEDRGFPGGTSHCVVLGLAAVATLLLGRAIGFGTRLDFAHVPLGALVGGVAVLALVETVALRGLQVGPWRACLAVSAGSGLGSGLVLSLALGWLAGQGDLLGWSLAVIVGLLFLLLLGLTLLTGLSLLRLVLLTVCTRDPRASWLAPGLTLAPLFLTYAVLKILHPA